MLRRYFSIHNLIEQEHAISLPGDVSDEVIERLKAAGWQEISRARAATIKLSPYLAGLFDMPDPPVWQRQIFEHDLPFYAAAAIRGLPYQVCKGEKVSDGPV